MDSDKGGVVRRRLAALLLTLVAVLTVSVSAPQPAAADGIGDAINGACRIATGPVLGTILHLGGQSPGSAGSITGSNLCDKVGEIGEKKVKEAWKKVWDSVLGDVINSAADVVKWVIKKVLTVALMGPSVDLKGTGLWGGKATLAGMLVWLGLVIAAFGVMWQLGKMALTGQAKHAGRALVGWVENTVLSTIGVSVFALLLSAGDALTSGMVNATFEDDGKAAETIVAALVPTAISNPITLLAVVGVLGLIGFTQLIMVFLRQSAIPFICLLLPVAGGGRAGGDTTRKWAPRLITSGLVIVAYKPILALIICVGFSEFGHSQTLAEWLRGCATLLLGILAPGPLTKIFAPFGEAVGGGMASGGAIGGLTAAAGFLGGRLGGGGGGGGDDDSDGGAPPTTPMSHAQMVAQTMGSQNGGGDGEGGDSQGQTPPGDARVPGQGTPGGTPGPDGGTPGAGTGAGTGAAGTAAAAGATAGVGLALNVLDGVNNAVQDASGQIGNGGETQ